MTCALRPLYNLSNKEILNSKKGESLMYKKINVKNFLSLILFFAFLVFACSSQFQPRDSTSKIDNFFQPIFVTNSQLKITNYNVLNLFDAQDDGKRQDPTFLRKDHKKKKECEKKRSKFYKRLCKQLDWTKQKFQFRVSLLAEALRFQGDLPDVLGLEEVENVYVLQVLAEELGYSTKNVLITEGSDQRGIDVGLIYKTDKLKLVSYRFLRSPHAKRDVLVARFKVLAKKDFILDIYVNHWPSQYNRNPMVRFQMGMLVRKDLQAQQTKYGLAYGAVVMGDFNVTEWESPNGLMHALQSPFWKGRLRDVQYLAERKGLSAKMPKGTYWYRSDKKWVRLDRILVTQNMVKGDFEIVPKSFLIGSKNLLTDFEFQSFLLKGLVKIPYRYDFLEQDGKGYSDHLPISVSFEIK